MSVPLSPQRRAQAPVVMLGTEPDARRVHAAVRRAMELARWTEFIAAGADVAIKPNLGWDKLIPGAISAPWVIEGIILAIREHVASIHLVESDQVVVRADRALVVSGLDRVCRRHGVYWHNMSRGVHVRRSLPAARVLREVEIPEILTRCELITVPVMKTHNKTVITGALKNQWGCLRELRHNFHPVLDDALADVNELVQPRFCVMDGTVALEGNGPKSGIPKEMGVVLASANLVGLDCAAARLMRIDPASAAHLERCAAAGLGVTIDAGDVVGDLVEEAATPFLPARHNAVSWIELSLRGSLVERLAFRTPLLHALCWGARRYYDVWDLLVGRRRRRTFFAASQWARQWTSESSNTC